MYIYVYIYIYISILDRLGCELQQKLQTSTYNIGDLLMNVNLLNAHGGQIQSDNFDEIFRGKSKVKKIFEGEMFMRTLIIILRQIFSKIIFNFKLIVKSIIGPDDNLWRNSSNNGLTYIPLTSKYPTTYTNPTYQVTSNSLNIKGIFC